MTRTNRAGDAWTDLDDLQERLAADGYADDLALTPAESLLRQVEALTADLQEIYRLRAQAAELPELRRLADLGKRHRAELIEEALAEGKRAMGVTFDEVAYRALLENAPLETLKHLRDDWRRSTTDRGFIASTAVRPRPVA